MTKNEQVDDPVWGTMSVQDFRERVKRAEHDEKLREEQVTEREKTRREFEKATELREEELMLPLWSWGRLF